jgi:hypothetical protein
MSTDRDETPSRQAVCLRRFEARRPFEKLRREVEGNNFEDQGRKSSLELELYIEQMQIVISKQIAWLRTRRLGFCSTDKLAESVALLPENAQKPYLPGCQPLAKSASASELDQA